MKSFTDNTGRAWLVNVNVGTIKRVRALCGVDLANIISIESGQKPKIEQLECLIISESAILRPLNIPRVASVRVVIFLAA